MGTYKIDGSASIFLKYSVEVDTLSDSTTLSEGVFFYDRKTKEVYRKEAIGQTPAHFTSSGNVDLSDYARLSVDNAFTANQSYRKSSGDPVYIDLRHFSFNTPNYNNAGYSPSLPTDIFARISNSTSAGGLQVDGFSSNAPTAIPFVFASTHGSQSPVVPAIYFAGRKNNGAGSFTQLASSEKVFGFYNSGIIKMEQYGSGRLTLHDGVGNQYIDFDHQNDIEFTRSITISGTSYPEIRYKQFSLTGIPTYGNLGFTPVLENGTFGVMGLTDNTVGGMSFSGYNTTASTFHIPLSFIGVHGSNPTQEVITFIGSKNDGTGTGVTTLANDEAVIAFRTGSPSTPSTRYLAQIFGSGSWYQRYSVLPTFTPVNGLHIAYEENGGNNRIAFKKPNGSVFYINLF